MGEHVGVDHESKALRADTQARPEVVIIAALAVRDRLIGRGLDLPWRLPEDLRRFKRLTTGHPLIMGRRTFESIVHQFGEPLPGRRMLVLTSRGQLARYADIETCGSMEEALGLASEAPTIFIGGGARVFAEALPLADRLELTLVDGAHQGDTYFPPYEHLIGPVFHLAHEDARDGFRFVTYARGPAE